MRRAFQPQLQIGQTPIDQVEIDLDSRDDIPSILHGLKRLYMEEPVFGEVMELLESNVLAGRDHGRGRPGMDFWQILVLAVLKQGLNCDFDRLKELADQHATIREMLGVGPFDRTRYSLQRLIDNVGHLTPDLLKKINRVVVGYGHTVLGCAEDPLGGRCDSFVVETDVHYPTDVSLLWDAMRGLLRTIGPLSGEHGVRGWRQWKKQQRDVRGLFNRVRSTRRAKGRPERVERYLTRCRSVVERARGSVAELTAGEVRAASVAEIEGYIVHAERQIDQVDRRLLEGETIPHEEKVFSIFEEHTRWISKGKAGCPVELGVPVCVIEDQHRFVLNHHVIWEGSDVDVAVPFVRETRDLFPKLRVCSFDRGFHSPANRDRLDDLLEVSALPKKGRLSKADMAREATPEFRAARHAHPAVESAVNHLEHHGLDRILSLGAAGFDRTVALSVLGANIHRLGKVPRKQALEAQKRRHRRTA